MGTVDSSSCNNNNSTIVMKYQGGNTNKIGLTRKNEKKNPEKKQILIRTIVNMSAMAKSEIKPNEK